MHIWKEDIRKEQRKPIKQTEKRETNIFLRSLVEI